MVCREDLEKILACVKVETKGPDGRVNLEETARRTGISYKRLRWWKHNGYHLMPDGMRRKSGSRQLQWYTGTIDKLLMEGVTNSEVVVGSLRRIALHVRSHATTFRAGSARTIRSSSSL